MEKHFSPAQIIRMINESEMDIRIAVQLSFLPNKSKKAHGRPSERYDINN